MPSRPSIPAIKNNQTRGVVHVEPKIEAMIEKRRGHRALLDAFRTDMRPLCANVRAGLGPAPDPSAAFGADGYAKRVAGTRAGGKAAAWL